MARDDRRDAMPDCVIEVSFSRTSDSRTSDSRPPEKRSNSEQIKDKLPMEYI